MKIKLGCLVVCVDRRYWFCQQQAFMEKTGLQPSQFWSHHEAGGAGKVIETKNLAGVKHAVHSGAQIIGWGMHGNNCGGYPQLNNSQLKAIHSSALEKAIELFSDRIHLKIWSEANPPQTTVQVIHDPQALFK